MQAERDELYAKFEASIYDVQQKTGLKSALLEKKVEVSECNTGLARHRVLNDPPACCCASRALQHIRSQRSLVHATLRHYRALSSNNVLYATALYPTRPWARRWS